MKNLLVLAALDFAPLAFALIAGTATLMTVYP
jgi:hypothetical protein